MKYMKYTEDNSVITLLLVVLLVLCAGLAWTSTQAPPRTTEDRARIYVVDTGINFNSSELKEFKCIDSHISIVGTSALVDTVGHGTAIAKLIVKGLNSSTVCLTSIKWYDAPSAHNLGRALYTLAATIQKNSYVNISASGDEEILEEKQALTAILATGAMVSVAAGNNMQNLDSNCNIFPACYYKQMPRNFFVAGATNKYSNNGKFIQVFIAGSTSEATAMLTNKIVTLMEN